MKGYVYVLTNEAMPGLVKIGRSKIAGAHRAAQIYSGDTGVPMPFEVYFECLFDDCVYAEEAIHEELEEHRINPRREFFRIDADEAALQVMKVRAFLIDHTVEHIEMVPDAGRISDLAHQLDIHPFEAVSAIDFLIPQDIRLAIARRDAGRERARSRGLHLVDLDGDREPFCCHGCGHMVTLYAEHPSDGMTYCHGCFEYTSQLEKKSG